MILVFRLPISHAPDADEKSAMPAMSGCAGILANWQEREAIGAADKS
jgi:hypothetical protein